MKIENGEIIELDNEKEYICVARLEDNGINYLYLLSNFKPIEIINNDEEKRHVLELFDNIIKN